PVGLDRAAFSNPRKPVAYRIGGRFMPARHLRVPSYRLHKPTGLAVVSIGGRDVYLGKHESSESRAEYDRIIAEWLATGRVPTAVDSACGAGISVGLGDAAEVRKVVVRWPSAVVQVLENLKIGQEHKVIEPKKTSP